MRDTLRQQWQGLFIARIVTVATGLSPEEAWAASQSSLPQIILWLAIAGMMGASNVEKSDVIDRWK